MSNDSSTPAPGGQFLVYQTQDGKLKIDVRFEGETVWLTQQHMSDVFQTTKQNVSLHISNIYEERELERAATVKESLTVQKEGNRSVHRTFPTRWHNPEPNRNTTNSRRSQLVTLAPSTMSSNRPRKACHNCRKIQNPSVPSHERRLGLDPP